MDKLITECHELSGGNVANSHYSPAMRNDGANAGASPRRMGRRCEGKKTIGRDGKCTQPNRRGYHSLKVCRSERRLLCARLEQPRARMRPSIGAIWWRLIAEIRLDAERDITEIRGAPKRHNTKQPQSSNG